MTFYTYKFTWPASPGIESVVATGSFDDWAQKDGVLTPSSSGNFEAVVKLPARERIVFKYVLNGSDWVTHPELKTVSDEHGNFNNFVDADELTAVEEFVREATSEASEADEVSASLGSAGANVADAQEAESNEKDKDDKPEDKLTHVSTAESSYASVSIPPSSDSAYEHVSQDSDDDPHEPDGKPRRRNAPEDITPTASRAGTRPQQPQDEEVTTLGAHSCDSSISGRALQPDSETVDASTPKRKPMERRRDGFMGRLKSIFQ
ncbi:hypothetical protein A9F13_26g00473 [Clavispora lusitaniae]|uniref:AMP-activated protein kinase glycogen-binding domain-containing protein n=1 Tax=Clavispora lusitaniae TaxID=36911 RepID=A0AA91PVB0_CLALS|nr:hypothetical protein A9F13_26g00473 [Clavispora lusitaniae]